MKDITYSILTERLALRQWVDSDIAPFIEMNKDPEIMKFFPGTLSDEESIGMIERIKISFAVNGFGLFAVENRSTKEFIGYTGFAKPDFESFFTPCIEIGWRFKKEVWRNGYATEAASACLQHGFRLLGFDSVFSFTSILNLKSEKVMERIGMTKIAAFEHPKIDPSHVLCRHVLYRIFSRDIPSPTG